MIVDPVQALVKSTLATTFPLLPTSTSGASVTPLPTVVPDLPVVEKIHESGTRMLWVVFVVMVISSATFAGLSWKVPVSRRLFHTITTLITIIASLSYFAMATGQGSTWKHIRVRHSNPHVPDTFTDVYRQIFWARYVDWALTTPLLLLDLCLLAGLNGGHTLMAILADVIMVLGGLFATFGHKDTPQKWGWYAIACISYLVVIWHLVLNGRATAFNRSDKVGKFFAAIAGYTLLVWTAYPIVWGFSEGSRHMSVDSEIIAYGILDILAKPVFGAWLLITHRRLPETNVEVGGFWAYGVSGEGAIRIADDDGA